MGIGNPDDRCIGVVGVGTLGTTVVQLGLDTGDRVVAIHSHGVGKREKAEKAIDQSVEREVKRGRMSRESANAALDRLVISDDLAALDTCGVVIESIPEDLAAKQAIVAAIEANVATDTVIASSTSSLPASVIAVDANHPERIVVTHYVWPANRVDVVEVAVPAGVTVGVERRLDALLSRQGKTQLRVSDKLGFFITRVLYIYWGRTAALLAQGVSPDQIDEAMEAAGWPMGPCRLLDGTGIESVLQIFDVVRPALGDRADDMLRLRPLVEAGFVGGARAQGLYDHRGPERVTCVDAIERVIPRDEPPPADLVAHLEAAFTEETRRCLAEGVISSWDQAALGIDGAYGFPGGLLRAVSELPR